MSLIFSYLKLAYLGTFGSTDPRRLEVISQIVRNFSATGAFTLSVRAGRT